MRRLALSLLALLALGLGAALPLRLTRREKHQPLHRCFLFAVREWGRCGTVRVFEDRDSRQGRTIGLRVVVMPARGASRRPPLFILTGGPGLAATELESYAKSHLGAVRQERDFVFVDQRGTGGSSALGCGLYDVRHALQPYANPMFPIERVTDCRSQLEQRADLTQYTTSNSADDLDDVRRFLGVDSVALFGVSYGGRLALVFLRRHGEHVERAVLQGTPTPEQPIRTTAATVQRALDSAFAACARDVRCHAASPRPRTDLLTLLDHLAAKPVTTSLWNWQRLSYEPVELTRRGVAEGVWRSLYSPAAAIRMLRLIHAAAANDLTPLARALVAQGRASRNGRSEGLMLSVICSEDAPRLTIKDTLSPAGAILGAPVTAELWRACAAWPHAVIPAEFGAPVSADTPILLLTGGRDPIAPPEWSAAAARTLANGAALVDPEAGHAEMNDCVIRTIDDFYSLHGTQRIEAPCLRAAAR